MQRLVPGELLGRVASLDAQISWGLIPVSFALTGPASALFGPRQTIVGGALIGGLVPFALVFVPGVREPEKPGGLQSGALVDPASKEL